MERCWSPRSTALDAEVHTELARREDLWRPLANELRDWVPAGARGAPAQAQVAELKKAENWFKTVQADMRDQRFQSDRRSREGHLATAAAAEQRGAGGRRLQGAATQRSVALDVTVDGVAGAALGVMSQGELNALALSLFMPRASLPRARSASW